MNDIGAMLLSIHSDREVSWDGATGVTVEGIGPKLLDQHEIHGWIHLPGTNWKKFLWINFGTIEIELSYLFERYDLLK